MTPIIEELLVRIFTLTNYRICTVDSRHIATHGWIEYGVNTFPDSVLLDVDISTGTVLKDPLDFLHSFSEHWNARFTGADRPELLLLTTQAQRRHELQLEAYVDAVVTKPFRPQFLLHTMKTALEQRQEKRREALSKKLSTQHSDHIFDDLHAASIRKGFYS
jgi:DNA-binding response OmpR family regulator